MADTPYISIPPYEDGAAVPLVLDGTGLTTSVPLLIKNGKTLSGVEVQVTGTAASGFILRDSGGVFAGAFGLAVALGDFVANAAAGDAVLTGPASGTKRLLLKTLSSGGVQILSPSSTGAGSGGYIFVDELTYGAVVGYGTSRLTLDPTRTTVTNPIAISASNSLTAVAQQVAGNPNTGIGQIGGANTISGVAGGVEAWRASATLFLVNGKLSVPTAQTQATIGANGAAAALTALPVGYIKVDINGAAMIVPYYNA